ncbi:hypothetical protein [Streptomyces sp. NBC_01190]|uniref:hypothetical protein n=1 Tax=Streptomyces sp. NBC_01190 TaxID=2903767 RepID=UPI00386EC48B|nr:hypothetical protein OG519_06270 [Streptomyces sp. NBC_01190]
MSGQPSTLIYDQLVSERGDIPAQVRAAAEEIARHLERDLGRIAEPPGSDRAAGKWFR